MATTAAHIEAIPAFFEMPCIACSAQNTETTATHTVISPQGVGLASCQEHIAATEAVALSVATTQLVEIRHLFKAQAALPYFARRPVPDSSSNGYSGHHSAVYADARVTDLDIAARYTGELSDDNGQTWRPDTMPPGWTTVCGGHVQVEVASALLAGWDVLADGTTRIVRHSEQQLSRWTLTILSPEETAAMEKLIQESRARAR